MRKFIKFCSVGVCNTALTFVVFFVLSEVLGVNYLLSSFLGYALGVVNSFVLNKIWTFQNKERAIVMQFTRFAVVNVISLGVNLFAMYICVDKLYISKVTAQVIATGFSTVVNYVGSRLLVFNSETLQAAEDGTIESIPDLQKVE